MIYKIAVSFTVDDELYTEAHKYKKKFGFRSMSHLIEDALRDKIREEK